MLGQGVRAPNRFEKYAPEIVAIAAVLDEEVRYSHGAWRLVHCGRPLWESDSWGPLTREGAREVVEQLREEIVDAMPHRRAPLLQRAVCGIDVLRKSRFEGEVTLTVRTRALDHMSIRHSGNGAWDGWVAIGRERVEVHGGSHEECVERLSEAAVLRWGTAADVAN